MIKSSIFYYSICADLISDIQETHPTIGELNRLFGIVEKFDEELVEAAAINHVVARNYAQVLRAVGEQTAYIINANYIPRKLTPIKQMEEASPKEDSDVKNAFGQTAEKSSAINNHTNGTANTSTQIQASHSVEPSFRRGKGKKVDQVLVKLAISKIRIIYERAHKMVFTAGDAETGIIYANALGAYFRSACWRQRADKDKGGNALEPLGDIENEDYNKLRSFLFGNLETGQIANIGIGIYCDLLASLHYAEWEVPVDDFAEDKKKAFYAAQWQNLYNENKVVIDPIKSFIEDSDRLALPVLSSVLKFIDNIIISTNYMDKQNLGDHITVLYDIADKVFKIGEFVEAYDDEDMRHFIRVLSSAVSRLVMLVKKKEDLRNASQGFMNNVDAYIQKHAIHAPVGGSVLGFYTALQESSIIGHNSVKPLLPKLATLISAAGVKGKQLNTPAETNLTYYIIKLILRDDVLAADVKIFLDALIPSVGKKMRNSLVESLIPVRFDIALSGDVTKEIIRHIQSDIKRNDLGKKGLGKDWQNNDMHEDSRAQAMFGLWGDLLLSGDYENVARQADEYWRIGDIENDIRMRTLALRGMALLGSFCAADDPLIRQFYERVQKTPNLHKSKTKLFIQLTSALDTITQLIQNHDSALQDTLSTLADKDIAAGNDPVPWVKHALGGQDE